MSELNVGQLKGLPVNSNVMTVPAGHTLYAPGHVVQVVTQTFSTSPTTTSGSFVDTGYSLSITPKSSTSRLLITYNGTATSYLGNGQVVGGQVAITDESNNVLAKVRVVDYQGTSMERASDWNVTVEAVVNASSTSARTYKVRHQTDTAGSMGQRADSPYNPIIKIMEIAA